MIVIGLIVGFIFGLWLSKGTRISRGGMPQPRQKHAGWTRSASAPPNPLIRPRLRLGSEFGTESRWVCFDDAGNTGSGKTPPQAYADWQRWSL